jgi:uracil-DNA glycosylase family 4
MEALAARIESCRACPRLVAWRESVAMQKRASFRHDVYWGRPVAGFGDTSARIAVVGLAPAAHGANRTGRIFTGDRSGDWLFASMHRAGLANQALSVSRDDGLELQGAFVTAAVRCAPPANKPAPSERDECLHHLVDELGLLEDLRVVVALGRFAYEVVTRMYRVTPRPKFGHLYEVAQPEGPTILCSFHPSQQNTFTGRLTEAMTDAVFVRARRLAGI